MLLNHIYDDELTGKLIQLLEIGLNHSQLLWCMIDFEDREAQGRRYVRQ